MLSQETAATWYFLGFIAPPWPLSVKPHTTGLNFSSILTKQYLSVNPTHWYLNIPLDQTHPFLKGFYSKGNCIPNQNWVCTSCAFSWNEQYFLEKKNVNILKQNVWETKKGYWNISKSCGSWVIDENNILHALINNSRTAGPT